REVDNSVLPRERNRRLGPLVRQDPEPGSLAARQDDCSGPQWRSPGNRPPDDFGFWILDFGLMAAFSLFPTKRRGVRAPLTRPSTTGLARRPRCNGAPTAPRRSPCAFPVAEFRPIFAAERTPGPRARGRPPARPS